MANGRYRQILRPDRLLHTFAFGRVSLWIVLPYMTEGAFKRLTEDRSFAPEVPRRVDPLGLPDQERITHGSKKREHLQPRVEMTSS